MLKNKFMRVTMLLIVLILAFSPLMVIRSQAAESARKVSASVSGVVWQDVCLRDCDAGSSLKAGNGRANPAEPRISAVRVGLAKGKCRDKQPFTTVLTNSRGFYKFSNLAEGYYCVTVDSRQNQAKFRQPGYWSRPKESANLRVARYQIHVTESVNFVNISFGWNLYR